MRDRIQITTFGGADKADAVFVEELEIDYLALADALLGREPMLHRRSAPRGRWPEKRPSRRGAGRAESSSN